jgi:hypothetical protein
MAMQPIASVVLLEQTLPERFIAGVRLAVRKTRPIAALALGLALVPLPTQAAFGQINSQQEQQQRDQQQREEQQREQQQRDQQQRDEQQREQQQREEQQRQQEQREQQQREQEQQRQQQQREQEQQREQQQREQQQREQQQRDQQQRERQQREQQQREQQAREQQQREEQQREREAQERQQQQRDQELKAQQQREQQAREQQQREEQQREQQQREAQERQQQQRDKEVKAQQQREQQAREQQQRSSELPVPSSKTGSEVSHATAKTPAADVKRAPSDIRSAGTERKPDTSLPIKPAPHAIEPKPVPDLAKKTCKDGPCQPCSSAQSKGKKDGPCEAAATKAGGPAAPKDVGAQTCAAGQVWNGTQCLPVGAALHAWANRCRLVSSAVRERNRWRAELHRGTQELSSGKGPGVLERSGVKGVHRSRRRLRHTYEHIPELPC